MVNEVFILALWAAATTLSRKFGQAALAISLSQKIVV
jgi:hypothetical protein